MTSQNGTDFHAATPKHAAVDRTAEAKGYLALAFNWTISTLYYSSGEYVVIMHLSQKHGMNTQHSSTVRLTSHMPVGNCAHMPAKQQLSASKMVCRMCVVNWCKGVSVGKYTAASLAGLSARH